MELVSLFARNTVPYLVLLAGVAIVSTASVLIRLAQLEGIPTPAIAAGRLGIAALALTPLAWIGNHLELRRLKRPELLLGIAAGCFLALHFLTWIQSLAYTSVASSAVLVTTTPVWVGLFSWLFLREKPSRTANLGITLAMLGGVLIGISDRGSASVSRPVLGDALALAGAIFGSGYFLIGRAIRHRMSILAYVWLAYTTSAVVLIFSCLISGVSLFGYTQMGYFYVVAVALGPQLLGHTALNWSLRHLTATFVAVAILGEPVGASFLSLAVLGEQFSALQLIGFVILLTGIYRVAKGEKHEKP